MFGSKWIASLSVPNTLNKIKFIIFTEPREKENWNSSTYAGIIFTTKNLIIFHPS